MTSYSKFGNRFTDYEGITFHSDAEARRYQELQLELAAGEITDLRLQVPFEVVPRFVDRNGKTHTARIYKADFAYFERGHYVIEDVKGAATELFKLKWAICQQRYPEYVWRITKVGR